MRNGAFDAIDRLHGMQASGKYRRRRECLGDNAEQPRHGTVFQDLGYPDTRTMFGNVYRVRRMENVFISGVSSRLTYFAAFRIFAQRFFCAAAILARASGERVCFFGADAVVGAAVAFPAGLPVLRFVVIPFNRALTCWSRAMSASS
jgi:hypothetical protein